LAALAALRFSLAFSGEAKAHFERRLRNVAALLPSGLRLGASHPPTSIRDFRMSRKLTAIGVARIVLVGFGRQITLTFQ
jgi:hypothetical protein